MSIVLKQIAKNESLKILKNLQATARPQLAKIRYRAQGSWPAHSISTPPEKLSARSNEAMADKEHGVWCPSDKIGTKRMSDLWHW